MKLLASIIALAFTSTMADARTFHSDHHKSTTVQQQQTEHCFLSPMKVNKLNHESVVVPNKFILTCTNFNPTPTGAVIVRKGGQR